MKCIFITDNCYIYSDSDILSRLSYLYNILNKSLKWLYRKLYLIYFFFEDCVSMRKKWVAKNYKELLFETDRREKNKVVHCDHFCALANISLESDINILCSLFWHQWLLLFCSSYCQIVFDRFLVQKKSTYVLPRPLIHYTPLHRCSIGLRSGDCGGQLSIINPLFWN